MTEALVGIATLKAAGAEQRAMNRWSNLFFEHLNVSVRRDSFSAVLDTAMGGLRLLAPLLLLWVGPFQVLHGVMTLGTMLALNALAVAFLTPLERPNGFLCNAGTYELLVMMLHICAFSMIALTLLDHPFTIHYMDER